MTPDQLRRMRMRRNNLLMAYASFASTKAEQTPPEPPVGPGGAADVLLLSNGTDGLLLTDGASFLKLASSS